MSALSHTRRRSVRCGLVVASLVLVAASCGSGTTETVTPTDDTVWQRPTMAPATTVAPAVDTTASETVPSSLGAVVGTSEVSEDTSAGTTSPAPEQAVAPTSAAPNTSVAPDTAPPTTPAPPTTAANTCSTGDYTVTLPTGIQTSPSGQFSCVAFAAKAVPVTFECDCTLSLSVRFEPGATNAGLVTDYEVQTGTTIATTPLTVAGLPALQMEEMWPLSEVQVGSTGQSAMRYVHLIEESGGVIVVTADEFADWNDATAYADRKAAANAMVASLVP